MSEPFITGIAAPDYAKQPALWFLFQGHHMLVKHSLHRPAQIPFITSPDDIGLKPLRNHQYMGFLKGESEPIHCYCNEIEKGIEPPAGYRFETLRPLYSQLDETAFRLAGRAIQIVDWDRSHQFCGRCGNKTVDHGSERSKVCPQCGMVNYPRLAPAIIVRVQRESNDGPEILLARAKRFPSSMFSVLAGFVEPGETLEECLQREVMEEVGITVKNIRYFGSQPWPFPHSLMVAFIADHDSGELAVDPAELAEACWFSHATLPTIPPPPSIANLLITDWIESNP